jgi:hypothetical protein
MFLGHEIPIPALSSSRQLEGTCIVDAFEAAPTQPNPLVKAWAVRDLPETVRQVVFAPCETLRLDQGNGLSAGHLRPLNLPPGIGAKCRPVSGPGSRDKISDC